MSKATWLYFVGTLFVFQICRQPLAVLGAVFGPLGHWGVSMGSGFSGAWGPDDVGSYLASKTHSDKLDNHKISQSTPASDVNTAGGINTGSSTGPPSGQDVNENSGNGIGDTKSGNTNPAGSDGTGGGPPTDDGSSTPGGDTTNTGSTGSSANPTEGGTGSTTPENNSGSTSTSTTTGGTGPQTESGSSKTGGTGPQTESGSSTTGGTGPQTESGSSKTGGTGPQTESGSTTTGGTGPQTESGSSRTGGTGPQTESGSSTTGENRGTTTNYNKTLPNPTVEEKSNATGSTGEQPKPTSESTTPTHEEQPKPDLAGNTTVVTPTPTIPPKTYIKSTEIRFNLSTSITPEVIALFKSGRLNWLNPEHINKLRGGSWSGSTQLWWVLGNPPIKISPGTSTWKLYWDDLTAQDVNTLFGNKAGEWSKVFNWVNSIADQIPKESQMGQFEWDKMQIQKVPK